MKAPKSLMEVTSPVVNLADAHFFRQRLDLLPGSLGPAASMCEM